MERVKKLQQQLGARQALIAQLQTECVEIEEEVTEVQRQHGITSGFRFLDLPREIRDLVYELCVSKGRMFLPFHRYEEHDVRHIDFHSREHPEWQLLSTNRQIRDEAAKVLLSQNQIVLHPNNDQRLLCPDTVLPGKEFIYLESLAGRYLSSVSITLNQTNKDVDIPGLHRAHYRFARATRHSGTQRTLFYHNDLARDVGRWELLLWSAFVKPMRHLQIDLTGCDCSLGCCRLVEKMSEAFYNVEAPYDMNASYGSRLSSIEILGTKTRAERQAIIAGLARGLYNRRRRKLNEGPAPTVTLSFRKFVPFQVYESDKFMLDGLQDMEDEEVDMQAEIKRAEDEGELPVEEDYMYDTTEDDE